MLCCRCQLTHYTVIKALQLSSCGPAITHENRCVSTVSQLLGVGCSTGVDCTMSQENKYHSVESNVQHQQTHKWPINKTDTRVSGTSKAAAWGFLGQRRLAQRDSLPHRRLEPVKQMRCITPASSDSRKRSIDFVSWEGGTWQSLDWDQHCTGHNGDPRVTLCIAWPGSTHVPGFFHSIKAVGAAVVNFPSESIKQGLLSVFSSPA